MIAGMALMKQIKDAIAIQMVIVPPVITTMIQEHHIGMPVATAKNSIKNAMTLLIVSIPNYIGVPLLDDDVLLNTQKH
jgi:hypothetical protein